MDRFQSTVLALLSATGLAVMVAPADAFRMIQSNGVTAASSTLSVRCDANNGFAHPAPERSSIVWYLNPAGQGAGKGGALANAMNTWTGATFPAYSLTYAGTTSRGLAGDGVNTILWASGTGCTSSCKVLTVLYIGAGQVITESDIAFNPSFTWNTNGSDYDVEAVVLHELGHSLGLHHTDVNVAPLPAMHASYQGLPGRTMQTDDRAGIGCSKDRYFPTLTVTKAGAGAGTVTSSPGGINCGADCSEPYSSSMQVTLTAAAASGSVFSGWSGACSGTGTCRVTMTTAKTVTANYSKQSPPPQCLGMNRCPHDRDHQ